MQTLMDLYTKEMCSILMIVGAIVLCCILARKLCVLNHSIGKLNVNIIYWQIQYRDRAKERREKYGIPAPPPPKKKAPQFEVPEP